MIRKVYHKCNQIGRLAEFQSETWRSFNRKIGEISVGNLADLPKANPLKLKDDLQKLVDLFNSISPVPKYYAKKMKTNRFIKGK